jgi:signal peptidase I
MGKSKPAKFRSSTGKTQTEKKPNHIESWREAVESIVIAIVLAFLFRAYLAEAFVIPTGSMAPTLQGRHKDIKCPECSYRYRTGDSESVGQHYQGVVATTCPLCFFTSEMKPTNSAHFSHTGDRILVNKFAYEAPFGEPQRWDVIVFKFPCNAKQNYIKRLIGLPGETVWIRHGDIFIQRLEESERRIARKPPAKLRHMLQLVHDTEYLSTTLKAVGWPSPWGSDNTDSAWSSADGGQTYVCEADSDWESLRYRHYWMSYDTWERLYDAAGQGASMPSDVPLEPILITDFYAYNAQSRMSPNRSLHTDHPHFMGSNWVGDLAVECELEVLSDEGELELDLVEAGRHHRCRIDLATGIAKLAIDGGQLPLQDERGQTVTEVSAQTRMRGKGSYSLRFSNVDNQLLLWVNDRVCEFDHATTYNPPANERPVTSPNDPGDLAPVGLAARRARLRVDRLRVLRDIYYIAVKSGPTLSSGIRGPSEYSVSRDDPYGTVEQNILQMLVDPGQWNAPNNLFDRRQEVSFTMQADQFFPLGDNSPQSSDGRLWKPESVFVNGVTVEKGPCVHHVDRDLLIGKAVLVYWPHPWRWRVPLTNRSIPIFPNFQRMGLIH